MGVYKYVSETDRVNGRSVSDVGLNEVFQEALQYDSTLMIEQDRRIVKGFFKKRTEYTTYNVYHECPATDGSAYQARVQLSASGTRPIVMAYLYGIINGALAHLKPKSI